jgi:16S rRNA (uracil1498-N3)-methyltransferase
VPVLSERTVVADRARIQSKRDRWKRIIREAAEQSHRGKLPRLAQPLPFATACWQGIRDNDLALILWERAGRPGSGDPGRADPGRAGLDHHPKPANPPDGGTDCLDLATVFRDLDPHPCSVGLWIGPEGGYVPAEIALAQELGIRGITLGRRILRAETAALAATAITMSALGQMDR